MLTCATRTLHVAAARPPLAHLAVSRQRGADEPQEVLRARLLQRPPVAPAARAPHRPRRPQRVRSRAARLAGALPPAFDGPCLDVLQRLAQGLQRGGDLLGRVR